MSGTVRTSPMPTLAQVRQRVAVSRRAMIVGVASLLAVCERPADASEIGARFTADAFQAAQKAGKPILVEIYAAWCPTCQVQRPIIEELVMSERFKEVVYLVVEYDRQKDVLRTLNAQKQATLIMFKGNAEVGRSIGDTNRASIERLLASAI